MQPVTAEALGAFLAELGGSEIRVSSMPVREGDVAVLDIFDVHASVRIVGDDVATIAVGIGEFDTLDARLSVEVLLEAIANTRYARLVVRDPRIDLETVVVWSELDPSTRPAAIRARLLELHALAAGWRQKYGLQLTDDALSRGERLAHGAIEHSLADLKRVNLPPDRALRIAAVAFGVAGADGNISDAERSKLRAWLADVPVFRGMDPGSVVRAIGELVRDPGKHLMEAAKKLDDRELLLAWGLACEMAHANGEPSLEADRYLSNVASVFRMPSSAIETLAQQAQDAAQRRRSGQSVLPEAP